MRQPRIQWDKQGRMELLGLRDDGGLSYSQIASRYGISEANAKRQVCKSRLMLENGYLADNSKALPSSHDGKREIKRWQLQEIMDQHGYSPAEGVIAYRALLDSLMREIAEQSDIRYAMGSDDDPAQRIPMIALRADGKERLLGDEALREYVSLAREAAGIDKDMMPYIYPKLTSSSVKVDRETPPLLVIEPAQVAAKQEETS